MVFFNIKIHFQAFYFFLLFFFYILSFFPFFITLKGCNARAINITLVSSFFPVL
jgi:hypothetical protein